MNRQQNIDLVGPSNIKVLEVHSVSDAGTMNASVVVPLSGARGAPLVALHGISRNHDHLLQAFSEGASRHGRLIVLPHFCERDWPVFQRINRRRRPDKALLELLHTLRKMDLLPEGAVDLFGYSGGAQLAHRFAMLYPELIGHLHIGAAGWYTLPDNDTPYPQGLGPTQNGDARWGRRMTSGLRHYLARPITVYVGRGDTRKDDSLRSSPDLDSAQGGNRLERAKNYVRTLRKLQVRLGLRTRARLEIIDGAGHDFGQCSQLGRLPSRIFSAATLCSY